MDESLLVRLLGFPATLIHGETSVWDRWRWLKPKLPRTRNGEHVLDVGCGSGAFSIGAALRGYNSLGLSWDERNQRVATERARICGAHSAKFEILDVRALDSRTDLAGKFDIAICCENIEHILDDRKLMRDISNCLRPGGRLLLTTPNLLYRPMNPWDQGPFAKVEDGGHVRKGYSGAMLEELCHHANLVPERISYCYGFFSQKITALRRLLARIHPAFAWGITLPPRVLPPILDPMFTPLLRWPDYSICLEAYKPRFSGTQIPSRSGDSVPSA